MRAIALIVGHSATGAWITKVNITASTADVDGRTKKSEGSMNETKPLTQVWRENAANPEAISLKAQFTEEAVYKDCARDLEQFAKTHLAEQTEPSKEDWQAAKEMFPYTDQGKERSIYLRGRLDSKNAERQRLRALLCGNI